MTDIKLLDLKGKGSAFDLAETLLKEEKADIVLVYTGITPYWYVCVRHEPLVAKQILRNLSTLEGFRDDTNSVHPAYSLSGKLPKWMVVFALNMLFGPIEEVELDALLNHAKSP